MRVAMVAMLAAAAGDRGMIGGQMLDMAGEGRVPTMAEAERIRQIFVPAEDLREKHGFIPVLHDAVTFSGIADMGRMLPLLSNVPEALQPAVRKLASDLVAAEARLTQKAA